MLWKEMFFAREDMEGGTMADRREALKGVIWRRVYSIVVLVGSSLGAMVCGKSMAVIWRLRNVNTIA